MEKAHISEDWEYIAKSRALENGIYAIFINRAGKVENREYFGHSLIVDPKGKIMSKSGLDECIIIAELNFYEEDIWRKRRLIMRDRRPEIYNTINKLCS